MWKERRWKGCASGGKKQTTSRYVDVVVREIFKNSTKGRLMLFRKNLRITAIFSCTGNIASMQIESQRYQWWFRLAKIEMYFKENREFLSPVTYVLYTYWRIGEMPDIFALARTILVGSIIFYRISPIEYRWSVNRILKFSVSRTRVSCDKLESIPSILNVSIRILVYAVCIYILCSSRLQFSYLFISKLSLYPSFSENFRQNKHLKT